MAEGGERKLHPRSLKKILRTYL